MTITDFLLARIAEDEAAARAATPGPWRYNPGKVWHTDLGKLAAARMGNPFITGGQEFVGAGPDDGRNETTIGVATTGPADNPESMADAAHIARHNPARVLAECAAKRAVLAHHAEDSMGECTTCFVGMSGCGDPDCCGSSTEDMEEWPCQTVRALAAVYADHPDYEQEWA